jgi:hypothetical protein
MKDIKDHPLMIASLIFDMPLQRCLDSNHYPFKSRILIDALDVWTPIP